MYSILVSSESRYPVSRPKIKTKVEQILRRQKIDKSEISISFVGERKMKALNRQFLQIDEPTDVLSFPLEEPRNEKGILPLGDIVISYPHAQRYAREDNKLVMEIILELVEHGLMHLLGFDHKEGLDFNGNFISKNRYVNHPKI